MATLTKTRIGKRTTTKTLHESTVEARMFYPRTPRRHLRLVLAAQGVADGFVEYDLVLTADDVRKMLPELIKYVDLDDRDAEDAKDAVTAAVDHIIDNAFGSTKID